MVIKRFSNMLGSKRGTNPFSRSGSGSSDAAVVEDPAVEHSEDTPEGSVARGVRLFCESGGPNNQGEEVLHLPTIVEGAESSPAAAAVAAQQIRKFLSKDNYSRPHVQYNAIMLIRILADNPGATFTRNVDSKFTSTVKELLRTGKDPSVQQILRETLQALYMDKAYDTNLSTIFSMWSKESGMNISQAARGSGAGQNGYGGGRSSRHNSTQQGAFGEPRRGRETGLPTPIELAARIEEAKTSAKLLQQLVQSTPANELQANDLITEFAERCQTAQRSMQGYMNATNPSPDDDTMQTLIETSEQLSLAASKHQRAVLQARRSGASNSPAPQNVYAPPTVPPPGVIGYPSPVSPPSSTFAPTVSHDLTAYSPPPVPPPSMRANLERRSTGENVALTSNPPTLTPTAPSSGPPQLPPIRAGATEIPAPQYDNPFSDNHETTQPEIVAPAPRKKLSLEPISASSYEEDDDPYKPPSGHLTSSTVAELSMRPAPPRGAESWRAPVPGSPESYHPGFQSTPSYVKRQESAGDKYTMHGAGATIDEERVAESAGRYGRVSLSHEERAAGGASVSPVYERGHARGPSGNYGDVSPVESRLSGRDGTGNGAGTAAGYKY